MKVLSVLRTILSKARNKVVANKMYCVFYAMLGLMIAVISLLIVNIFGATLDLHFAQRFGIESEIKFAHAQMLRHVGVFVVYIAFLVLLIWFIGLLEQRTKLVAPRQDSAAKNSV